MTQWGIETLFNPGKRHMDEEKRRLQSTREEVGDSSGGRRIDLESGTVKISRPGKRPAEAEDAAAENAEAGNAEAEDETAETEQAETEQAEADSDEAGREAASETQR
jgi:hypothetical protein